MCLLWVVKHTPTQCLADHPINLHIPRHPDVALMLSCNENSNEIICAQNIFSLLRAVYRGEGRGERMGREWGVAETRRRGREEGRERERDQREKERFRLREGEKPERPGDIMQL